jgi:hypothetical protein
VAAALGWPRVAFGDYVRSVARDRQLSESRVVLQELGAILIEELGWDQFCRSVLAQADWKPGESLVLDGIRHAEALVRLRSVVAPSEVLLVLVQAEVLTRTARLAERGAYDVSLEQTDAHSTEIEVGTMLPHLADLTVDGSHPVPRLVLTIVGWIRQRQSP